MRRAYDRRPAAFRVPPQRGVRIVETRRKAAALAALRRLRAGTSWTTVARASISAEDRRRGGLRRELERERQRAALGDFATDVGPRWAARTSCSPGRVQASCEELLARRRG